MKHFLAIILFAFIGCSRTSPKPDQNAEPVTPTVAMPPSRPDVTFKGRSAKEWLKQLRDRDENTKTKAHEALAEVGDAVLPDLVAMLDEDDLSVRASAMYVLGSLGTKAKPAIPAMRRTVPTIPPDKRGGVRLSLAVVEGEIQSLSSGVPIDKAVSIVTNHKDPELKLAVMKTWDDWSGEPKYAYRTQALEVLQKAKNDPDARVRQFADEIAGKMAKAK